MLLVKRWKELKEKIDSRKKEKALKMSEELSEKEMSSEELDETAAKASSFLDNKALGSVKEKLEVMIHLIRDPRISKVIITTLVGALLYLILPVDVIPDVIPLLGLVDDAFVISVIFDRAMKQLKKDPAKVGEIIDHMPTRLKKPAISLLGAAGGAYAGWKGGEALGIELENRKLNDMMDSAFKLLRENISSKIVTEEKNGFVRRMASSFFTLSLFLMAVVVNIVEPEGSNLWILSLLFLLASYSVGIYSFIKGAIVTVAVLRRAHKEKGIRNGIRSILREKVKLYGAAMTALDALKASWSALPDEDDIEQMALHSIRFFWLDMVRFIVVTLLMVLGFVLLRLFIRTYTGYGFSLWKLLLFPLFYR